MYIHYCKFTARYATIYCLYVVSEVNSHLIVSYYIDVTYIIMLMHIQYHCLIYHDSNSYIVASLTCTRVYSFHTYIILSRRSWICSKFCQHFKCGYTSLNTGKMYWFHAFLQINIRILKQLCRVKHICKYTHQHCSI